MRIIASSLDTSTDTFLHAGYVSGAPREYSMTHVKYEKPEVMINLDEALSIKGTLLVKDSNDYNSVPSLPFFKAGNVLHMAIGVILFLIFISIVRSSLRQYQKRSTVYVLAILAFIVMSFYYRIGIEFMPWMLGGRGTPTIYYYATPGDRPTNQYKDPEKATLAIMHGLLADGVINTRGSITSFDQIRDEVGLPTKELTDGMKYALRNYAYDGWGQRYFLKSLGKTERGEDKYAITSSGPDKTHNTADDISIEVTQANDASWDSRRWAYYTKKINDNLNIFFHSWPGGLFTFYDENLALSLTGSNMFDLRHMADLSGEEKEILAEAFQNKLPEDKSDQLYLWVLKYDKSEVR